MIGCSFMRLGLVGRLKDGYLLLSLLSGDYNSSPMLLFWLRPSRGANLAIFFFLHKLTALWFYFIW